MDCTDGHFRSDRQRKNAEVGWRIDWRTIMKNYDSRSILSIEIVYQSFPLSHRKFFLALYDFNTKKKIYLYEYSLLSTISNQVLKIFKFENSLLFSVMHLLFSGIFLLFEFSKINFFMEDEYYLCVGKSFRVKCQSHKLIIM